MAIIINVNNAHVACHMKTIITGYKYYYIIAYLHYQLNSMIGHFYQEHEKLKMKYVQVKMVKMRLAYNIIIATLVTRFYILSENVLHAMENI